MEALYDQNRFQFFVLLKPCLNIPNNEFEFYESSTHCLLQLGQDCRQEMQATRGTHDTHLNNGVHTVVVKVVSPGISRCLDVYHVLFKTENYLFFNIVQLKYTTLIAKTTEHFDDPQR